MSAWKLTIRNRSKVNRRGFGTLDDALSAAREEAAEILDTPRLEAVNAIRDYRPAAQTKARLEISGKGLLRPPTAGLDIKGDNSVVGYTGSVRRRPLPGRDVESIFASIEEALRDE